MKHIIILILATVLFSCSKEEDNLTFENLKGKYNLQSERFIAYDEEGNRTQDTERTGGTGFVMFVEIHRNGFATLQRSINSSDEMRFDQIALVDKKTQLENFRLSDANVSTNTRYLCEYEYPDILRLTQQSYRRIDNNEYLQTEIISTLRKPSSSENGQIIVYRSTNNSNSRWSVIINGKELGLVQYSSNAPICEHPSFVRLELPAGQHTIDFKSLDGYAWGNPVKFTVRGGECLKYDFSKDYR